MADIIEECKYCGSKDLEYKENKKGNISVKCKSCGKWTGWGEKVDYEGKFTPKTNINEPEDLVKEANAKIDQIKLYIIQQRNVVNECFTADKSKANSLLDNILHFITKTDV